MALIPVLGGTGSTLTGAQIKSLYEAEADTNAFDDDAKSKLDGVETGATTDQTGAEIKAAYEAEADTNAFDDAAKSKLNGIESGATADQTNTEILNAWQTATGRTVATDAAKLDGIEALADVTDATNVAAAGAVMNADTTTASMSFVIDDDSMATATNTTLPTSESVKAYVDAQVISAGAGDVVGPASAVDENIAVFDGTTGKLVKDGAVGVALISTASQPGDNISDFTNDAAFIISDDVTYENLSANADVGTGAAQVSRGNHLHAGVYEPVDATILRQADVDDTPANGVTTAPISSNWAFDHENNTANPHSVTAAQIGVESGADVTDTANVTAAGALMDSEVTNLAAVKAFDPTDYATAAQGTTADTALQPSDVDDTPVNGVTGAPISSNWAFDHVADANAHIDWTSTTENLSTSGTAATGALGVTGAIAGTHTGGDGVFGLTLTASTASGDFVQLLNSNGFQSLSVRQTTNGAGVFNLFDGQSGSNATIYATAEEGDPYVVVGGSSVDRSGSATLTVIGDIALSGLVDGRNIAVDGATLDALDAGGGGGSAAGTTYDNTTSGLAATDVQEAIDENAADIAGAQSSFTNLATAALFSQTGDDSGQSGFSGFVTGSTAAPSMVTDMTVPYLSIQITGNTQLDDGVSGTGTFQWRLYDWTDPASPVFLETLEASPTSIDIDETPYTIDAKSYASLAAGTKLIERVAIVAYIDSDVTDGGGGNAPDILDAFVIRKNAGNLLAGTPIFGTGAGTACEGDDDRIPDATEQAFLGLVSAIGDDYVVTPPSAGRISLAGNVATSTELANISNLVNTVHKVTGKMIFNTTTSKPVWSVGSAAGSVWVDATGATVHTPI